MSHYRFILRQILVIGVFLFPHVTQALPPKVLPSSREVSIIAVSKGGRAYEFSAGPYSYKFLWDSGPTELIIHAIHGYDKEGNLVASMPAGIIYYDFDLQRLIDIHSEPDALLRFYGNGLARYTTTIPWFRVPEPFYDNTSIQHVTIEFSVVDGRLSVGPWFPMLTDWGDASSVREHVEQLLW